MCLKYAWMLRCVRDVFAVNDEYLGFWLWTAHREGRISTSLFRDS